MADYIKNGISVIAGFSATGAFPIDARSVVDTITERDELVIKGLVFDGLITFVRETNASYMFKNGIWSGYATSQHVEYEMFGAVGDGITDDYTAIRLTHEFANANKINVHAASNKTYYLKNIPEPIEIQTDTMWNGAKFILDDTQIEGAQSLQDYFVIKPSIEMEELLDPSVLGAIDRETTYIETFKDQGLIVVELTNEMKRTYQTEADDTGVSQTDVLLIDNGRVLTSLNEPFEMVTKCVINHVDETEICISGGKFTHRLNTTSPSSPFHRGIKCIRSNVRFDALEYISESNSGVVAPYLGFIKISRTYNVILHGLFTNGIPGNSSVVTLESNVNVYIDDVNQMTFMNPAYSPIITGFNLENVYVRKSTFNAVRFIRACRDLYITSSTLTKVLVSGYGNLYINDSTLHGSEFVDLYSETGSSWRGQVMINNSILNAQDEQATIVRCHHDYTINRGFTSHYPSINADNIMMNVKSDEDVILINPGPIHTDCYENLYDSKAKGLYPLVMGTDYVFNRVKLNRSTAMICLFSDKTEFYYAEESNYCLDRYNNGQEHERFIPANTHIYKYSTRVSCLNMTVDRIASANTDVTGEHIVERFNQNHRLIPYLSFENVTAGVLSIHSPMYLNLSKCIIKDIADLSIQYHPIMVIQDTRLDRTNLNPRNTCFKSCVFTTTHPEAATTDTFIDEHKMFAQMKVEQINGRSKFVIPFKLDYCDFIFNTDVLITPEIRNKYGITATALLERVDFDIYSGLSLYI